MVHNFSRSVAGLHELCPTQGLPLVIKPVGSRGSRDVLRITQEVNLDWAYDMTCGRSPTGRVMLDGFLPGPQVSAESLVIEGQAYTPGFAYRNYEYLECYAAHIIENGDQLPSQLDVATQQSVRNLVQQATTMGIRNGVVKGDIVLTDGQPHVIELAARLSGSYFCTHEIRRRSGRRRQARGERVDPEELIPKWNRPVAQRYLFPSPGVVRAVEGADRFAGHPDVAYLEIRTKPSDRIGPVDSHPARAGVVITTGETVESPVLMAKNIVYGIQVLVE